MIYGYYRAQQIVDPDYRELSFSITLENFNKILTLLLLCNGINVISLTYQTKTNKMNTRENNKLIAEFMGNVDKLRHDNTFITPYWYDTDWNWLMQVVDKIENHNHGSTLFIIEDERCHVNSQSGFEIDSVGHTKIEAVYKACVEFIKWYNSIVM